MLAKACNLFKQQCKQRNEGGQELADGGPLSDPVITRAEDDIVSKLTGEQGGNKAGDLAATRVAAAAPT